MKKLISILLFALCTLNFALSQQYGWVDISSNLPDFPGDTVIINNGEDTIVAGISALDFINDNEGWISTFSIDTGTILHTIDGGLTWEIQSIFNYSYVVAIDMFNALNGYAADREGAIYHTINGGTNWDYHSQTFAYLIDMDFHQEIDTGFACGDNSAMFRITSLGVEQMNTSTISDLGGISCPASGKAWAAGSAIIVMFDNESWTSLPSLPAGTYNDIFFINSQKGWVVGTVLGKTSNGTEWEKCSNYPELKGDIMKVFFLDETNGWCVGTAGQMLMTTDGGDNWEITGNGIADEIFLNGVEFTSLNNGYVCGNDKTLLKYGLLSGTEEQGGREAGGQGSVEVWPNPTSGKFQITSTKHQKLCKLQIPSTKLQTNSNFQKTINQIDIVDLNGNVLEHWNTGTMELWNNETVELDISHLPAGLYFCRIQSGNQIVVKKIILLK